MLETLISVTVVECLSYQIDAVYMVSPMSLKKGLSISEVELTLSGSATNRAASIV